MTCFFILLVDVFIQSFSLHPNIHSSYHHRVFYIKEFMYHVLNQNDHELLIFQDIVKILSIFNRKYHIFSKLVILSFMHHVYHDILEYT